MEFRQLEYFLEIVDRGSVTTAAAHLHVAQPSMSQALRRLERELNAPLFDRVGRGMRLTSAGEALVGPARRMLRERTEAHAAVSTVQGLRGGRINIASLPSLTVDPLAELLGVFATTYPLVHVNIAESLQPDEIALRVENGECEIGFTPVPRPSESLQAYEIQSQPLVLLVPRDYRDLPDPATPADLAGHRFVTGPPGGSSRHALEAMMSAAGARLSIAVETESTEAIVPLVNAGAGVALIPRGLAATGSGRTRILRTEPGVTRPTFLVHRKEMTSLAGRVLVDLARSTRGTE